MTPHRVHQLQLRVIKCTEQGHSLHCARTLYLSTMASGGGPPDPSAPRGSAQSDKEGEESGTSEPSLLCVLCTRELRDPHLLCCLHCVCKECLERVEQQDGRLKCPQCGDTSTHPPPGQHSVRTCHPPTAEVQCVPVRCVSLAQHIEDHKLLHKITSSETILCSNSICYNPESPAVVVCFKCKEFLCETCSSAHHLMGRFTEGHTVKSLSELRSLPPSVLQSLVPQTVTPATCPCHEGEPLKYCCEQCATLLCQACTVDKDLGHQPRYLNRAAVAQHTQCLVVAREGVVRSREVHQKTAARLEAQSTAMDRMREIALQDTQRAFQTIHAAINRKKEELCSRIVAVLDEKKHSIVGRAQSCSREGESLAGAQTALSFLLTNGSCHEVVASKRLSHVRQSAATSQCRGGAGGASVSPVVRFLPQQEEALLTAIKEFGHIQDGASPLHCTVDPKPEVLRECPPVVLTLTAVDSSKIPCSSGGESVEAFLRPRPPVPGPSIKAKVEDRENGQYEVVFGVVYSGECELSVLVNGGHIRGSPFAVQVAAAILQHGHWVMTRNAVALGANKGSLRFPQQPGGLWGVAVSPVNGSVFVCDLDNSKIHVFDVERKHVRTFGQHGKGEGQLNMPQSIDVGANGQLFVANQCNHCVSVFREDGTFIRSIGQGKLLFPKDVLVHSSGLVYVVDVNNRRIAVFSREGELVHTIGSRGGEKGGFEKPSGVTVSPDGHHLYVSDRNIHQVQVFTLEGQYVRECGTAQLKGPRGLTVMSDGSVLVADRSNNRIAVFDKKGELVHSIAVKDPTGLAIDSRGDLLVASFQNKCVYYF